jgi:hypothetical protein
MRATLQTDDVEGMARAGLPGLALSDDRPVASLRHNAPRYRRPPRSSNSKISDEQRPGGKQPELRFLLTVGRLEQSAARMQLQRTAVVAGVRSRFAPHQLRRPHALEVAHEGIPLVVIQHANIGITSICLQCIDSTETIDTVHSRRDQLPLRPLGTHQTEAGSLTDGRSMTTQWAVFD